VRGGGLLLADSAAAQQTTPAAQALLSSAEAMPGVSSDLQLGEQVRHNHDGNVVNLNPAPGQYIPVSATGGPEAIATAFLEANRGVFGIRSPKSSFDIHRVATNKDITYVHFTQHYQGVEVLGSNILIKVFRDLGVSGVSADVMTDTAGLDAAAVFPSPAIQAETARDVAAAAIPYELQDEGRLPADFSASVSEMRMRDEQLVIYAPEVFETEIEPINRTVQQPRLSWKFVLTEPSQVLDEHVVLDAETGDLIQHWPVRKEACLWRESYRKFLFNSNGKRDEDDPPSWDSQVNLAFDYMLKPYNYFLNINGRKGWHDNCFPIRAVADSSLAPNAFFRAVAGDPSKDRMEFKDGWLHLDILAHEYTHGNVYYTSGLDGNFEAASLNESFSDMWAEFVDITLGTVSTSQHWELGQSSPVGTVRDMDNPHNTNQPEVYLEAGYWLASGDVHINGGVTNKLCQLLAGGDSNFRGTSYAPLSSNLTGSIHATSKLMFEVMANRLSSTSNFCDTGSAASQTVIDAALGIIDLGNDITWNAVAIQKVQNAVLAVELGACPHCDPSCS